MPRTATLLLLATSSFAGAIPFPPPPDVNALRPPSRAPGLPWEADWEFRRDFKMDGKVENGGKAEKYRLRQYDFGQGGKGRAFQGKKDCIDVNIELVRPAGGKTVILLRQQGPMSCTFYVGKPVKDGLYRGTWYDHKGQSGDWEMSFLKSVKPVGVYGTTSSVSYPGRPLRGLDGKPVVWKGTRAGFVVSALDKAGNLVKQTTSGEGGRYHLSLPPGKYRITFKTPERIMAAPKDVTVEVKEGSSHQIDAEGHLHLP